MPYFYEDDELDIQRVPGTKRYASHTPTRLDVTVHTPDHPFCYDPTCTCHRDEAKLQAVRQWVEEGLMTEEEATAYIAGWTL